MNPWSMIPALADVLTIIAAAIALWGVFSVLRSRPQPTVTARTGGGSVTVVVFNKAGTEPLRDLIFAKGLMDEECKATTWDGGGDWLPALGPRQTAWAEVADRTNMIGRDAARPMEFLHDVSEPHGFIMDVSWRHPLVPWRRVTRAVVWTRAARRDGADPTVLENGKARRALKAARLS